MSPAATLDPVESEHAALTTAGQLFYNRGIAAVTMGEIRDHSGVSLRRLYTLYPSKSDLVAAWLSHRHQQWMSDYSQRVEQRRQTGDSPVDAIFAALEAWMTETEFRGCGFINTHAERSNLTDEHLSIIRHHKDAVASYLETLTPEGRAIAVILDGAIVQAAIFGTAESIHHARRAAGALIRSEQ